MQLQHFANWLESMRGPGVQGMVHKKSREVQTTASILHGCMCQAEASHLARFATAGCKMPSGPLGAPCKGGSWSLPHLLPHSPAVQESEFYGCKRQSAAQLFQAVKGNKARTRTQNMPISAAPPKLDQVDLIDFQVVPPAAAFAGHTCRVCGCKRLAGYDHCHSSCYIVGLPHYPMSRISGLNDCVDILVHSACRIYKAAISLNCFNMTEPSMEPCSRGMLACGVRRWTPRSSNSAAMLLNS